MRDSMRIRFGSSWRFGCVLPASRGLGVSVYALGPFRVTVD